MGAAQKATEKQPTPYRLVKNQTCLLDNGHVPRGDVRGPRGKDRGVKSGAFDGGREGAGLKEEAKSHSRPHDS